MISSLAYRFSRFLMRQTTKYYARKMHVGSRVKFRLGLDICKAENITIGSDVSINSGCIFHAHAPIEIGDETLIAANVTIVTANHDVAKRGMEAFYALETGAVKIGTGCWLGAGVIVLPGVSIGDGVVVGAGSVVTKDLPSETICVGVPAKPIRERRYD